MTWTKLLANHDVQRHQTSKKELDDMRALVARDLADSNVAGLSADRRFATAYNAALPVANMALACGGCRVTAKTGHHKVTLDSVKLAVGNTVDKYADYFERCRRKRNVIDYTRSRVAADSEAKETVQQATDFYEFVEAWIDTSFPNLRR